MWHLFLRSNRRRKKPGRWSQTCISSLDSALIHLLALTCYTRWAITHTTRYTHTQRKSDIDNNEKWLKTTQHQQNTSHGHSHAPVHRWLQSWWQEKAWRSRGPGFLSSSGYWRASALSFPLHPNRCSTAPAQQEHGSVASHAFRRPRASLECRALRARPCDVLTSLSCGGSWCRSCLIRCFSPGLLTYGTFSSGKEL